MSQADPPKSNVAFPITVLIKSTAHLLAVAPNVAAIVYLLLRPPKKLTGLKEKRNKKQTNKQSNILTSASTTCFFKQC